MQTERKMRFEKKKKILNRHNGKLDVKLQAHLENERESERKRFKKERGKKILKKGEYERKQNRSKLKVKFYGDLERE